MNVKSKTCFQSNYFLIPLLFIVIIFIFLNNISNFKQYDLVQYWAGAKQFAANSNPYNKEELFKYELQASEGIFVLKEPIVLYATPIVFPFIYFLSYLDFNSTRLVWLTLTISIFYWLSLFYLKTNLDRFSFELKRIIIPIFLFFSFTPFYSAIWYGQISWLLYIGWVGFLIYYHKNPILSGVLLSLTLIKPHLLYLVYIFLLLDYTKNKNHINGLLFGAVTLLLLSYSISPNIFSWYIEFSKSPPIQWKTLNIGSWLQYYTNIHTILVRLTPSIIAVIILIILYFKRIKITSLDYNKNFLKLSSISLLTAPYGWVFDSVILFPIIGMTALSLYNSKKTLNSLALLLLIASLIMFFIPNAVSQDYYIWYVMLLSFVALKL